MLINVQLLRCQMSVTEKGKYFIIDSTLHKLHINI